MRFPQGGQGRVKAGVPTGAQPGARSCPGHPFVVLPVSAQPSGTQDCSMRPQGPVRVSCGVSRPCSSRGAESDTLVRLQWEKRVDGSFP